MSCCNVKKKNETYRKPVGPVCWSRCQNRRSLHAQPRQIKEKWTRSQASWLGLDNCKINPRKKFSGKKGDASAEVSLLIVKKCDFYFKNWQICAHYLSGERFEVLNKNTVVPAEGTTRVVRKLIESGELDLVHDSARVAGAVKRPEHSASKILETF